MMKIYLLIDNRHYSVGEAAQTNKHKHLIIKPGDGEDNARIFLQRKFTTISYELHELKP